MENKKDLFIKYLDMNAQKCSEEISKNILLAFKKALEQAAQLAYKEGFSKAMQIVNKHISEKNTIK